jgi:hypothetical protein
MGSGLVHPCHPLPTVSKGMYCSSESLAEVSYTGIDLLVATGVLFDSIEAIAGPLPTGDNGLLGIARNLWLKETSGCQNYRPW